MTATTYELNELKREAAYLRQRARQQTKHTGLPVRFDKDFEIRISREGNVILAIRYTLDGCSQIETAAL